MIAHSLQRNGFAASGATGRRRAPVGKKQLVKDIWRPMIVAAPIGEVAGRGGIAGLPLHWFPDQGPLRYLADPFGVWRGGMLHVFAEFFDYRDARGRIDLCVFDPLLRFVEQRPVVSEAWHLSYPFVFEAEGETWMLPEAYQSGGLTLYCARARSHTIGSRCAASNCRTCRSMPPRSSTTAAGGCATPRLTRCTIG